MNCVLFLLLMAIDTLLTSEITRERVGRLVELPEGYVPLFKLYLPVPGTQGRHYDEFEDASFRFRAEGTTFDCSWEFDENSGLVRSLKGLRESQATAGFLHPETITEHERASNAHKSAFDYITLCLYHETLEERGLDFLYKINEGSIITGTTSATFHEALINAIEHGSAYGQRGPVNVRFLGGDKGFAFLVDNPRDDFVLKPYTVEELTTLYTRRCGVIPQELTSIEAFRRFEEGMKTVKVVDEVKYAEYNQLAFQASQIGQAGVPYTRGNGVLRMMFGNKATVGFEQTEATNRVIVGYFL